MISFIRGSVVEKFPTHIILENNGIGFELLIPLSTYEQVHDVGEKTSLLTYLYVREDALTLYGFYAADERELFLLLLSVSGIGPKLALGILSGLPVQQIYQHIANGDEASLTKIKGLGKKTAQRLILDLKDRASDKVKQTAPAPSMIMPRENEITEQSLSALLSLGYSPREAEAAIAKAMPKTGPQTTVEELIRIVLSGE